MQSILSRFFIVIFFINTIVIQSLHHLRQNINESLVISCNRDVLNDTFKSWPLTGKFETSKILLRKYDGKIIKDLRDHRSIYILYNGTRSIFWNWDTFEYFNYTTDDIHYIPKYVFFMFQEGPRLNMYDNDFSEIARNIQNFIAGIDKNAPPIDEAPGFFGLYKPLPRVNNTLIILFGQYRTFDITCAALFKHLVHPNLPAKIVIVLDEGDEFLFNLEVNSCIQPYEEDFLGLIHGAHVVQTCNNKKLIEFCMPKVAIDFVNRNYPMLIFDYIIKSRVDVMVTSDIRVNVISAEHPQFFFEFTSKYYYFKFLFHKFYLF